MTLHTVLIEDENSSSPSLRNKAAFGILLPHPRPESQIFAQMTYWLSCIEPVNRDRVRYLAGRGFVSRLQLL